MPLSLDSESHRLLLMMRFVGKMWEQHGQERGERIRVSILLHQGVDAPGDDGSALHVIPSTSADGDVGYLRQVLRTYTDAGVVSSPGASPSPGSTLTDPLSLQLTAPLGTPKLPPNPAVLPSSIPPPASSLVVAPVSAAARNAAIDKANVALAAERVAAAPQEEGGVLPFAREWRGPQELTYKDLHHLCPALPTLNVQDAVAASAKDPVTLTEEQVLAFLSSIGAPNLASFKWKTIVLFTTCVRNIVNFFAPTRNLNRAKAWHEIGPAVANKYSYTVRDASYVTVSVNQAMVRSSGKHKFERAVTLAALHSESPFWRAACLIFRACNKNLVWDDSQDLALSKTPAPRDGSDDSSGGGKSGDSLDALLRGDDHSSSDDNGGLTDADDSSAGTPRPTKRRKAVGGKAGKTKKQSGKRKATGRKRSVPGTQVPGSGRKPALDRALWTDAPGLDLACRPKTMEELQRSRCSWFWINLARMGAGALPLSAYQTLGGLFHDRCAKQDLSVQAGTFARLYDVPGDGDCFYHALACGLMDRLAQFPSMPRAPFWREVGVHPGLLRWSVIAMQRTILESTPTALELLKTWGYLTNLGEPFDHAAVRAQLQDAIEQSESHHLWMGRYNGDYCLIANVLQVIIKVFRTRGCQSGGSIVPLPYDKDYAIADATMHVSVDDCGTYVGRVRCGKGSLTFEVSATYVPISFVNQARTASLSMPATDRLSFIAQNSVELARASGCVVVGVVHSGADHFMYPHVYPSLIDEFTGASLPAFSL